MTANQKFSRFIGIDVSKAKLDIYDDATGEFLTVENTAKAIEKYVSALSPDPELLIVVDLTGGYEALCVNTFYNRGFTVHRGGRAPGQSLYAFLRRTRQNRPDRRLRPCPLRTETARNPAYVHASAAEPETRNRKDIRPQNHAPSGKKTAAPRPAFQPI